MSKKAFDKIAEGLREALAVAQAQRDTKTTAYYPSELPEHIKEAVRVSQMAPEHEHLNDLLISR